MASSAMKRIMQANLIEDLGQEVEKNGSYLQKVAFRIGSTSDTDGLGDALQAAMFVVEKDPARGQTLLDLLDQYAQQSVQGALEKLVLKSGDPTAAETARISDMAELLQARIRLGREQMSLMRVQRDLADKMGLSGQNPAMAATGQMPTPISGGAPPMPMQAPGQMPGPQPPQPQPQPTPAPAPGKPGAKPAGGSQLPGSPMEAAAL